MFNIGNKIWTENNKKNYNLNPKFCKCCGIFLQYDKRYNKFCSHSCSAKFNNVGVVRNGNSPKNCVLCRKIIYTIHERCKICETKFKIENGIKVSPETIRNYLIKIRGYRCEECKNIEWNNKQIPLDNHHIDGNEKNNDLKNLLLLCKNCHALTDTYGCKKRKESIKIST